MEHKINWGITENLQADIRFEPNACRSWVMDVSLGCPHHCIYCLFSLLEKRVYRLYNHDYRGEVIPLKLDKFLSREDFPPVVYLCYSSDPLGNDYITGSTITVLKKLFKYNVNILFISKGIFSNDILETIRQRPELVSVQVGISSYDNIRNKFVEPGAPNYEERLSNIEKLSAIKDLSSLAVRIDPILPTIDDNDKNISRIIGDVSKMGVKAAVIGYIILTKEMRETWMRNEYVRQCAQSLSENVSTISGQELYSIPFSHKIEKLSGFRDICEKFGVSMSVCGCKDERLKNTNFEWICHPFNRKRREELMFNTGEELVGYGFDDLVSHLNVNQNKE